MVTWPRVWYGVFVFLKCVEFGAGLPVFLQILSCGALAFMYIIALGLFVAQTRLGTELNAKWHWFPVGDNPAFTE